MMRIYLTISLLVVPLFLFAQEISNPFFATLSQHPISIDKIEHTQDQTIVSLTIENQIEDGAFCADQNIFIQDLESNKKYKLIKSEDIPVCPSSYQFKYVGELLSFKLYFPRLNTTTKYINLIEDCNLNCFYIKGILLEHKTNIDLSLGYRYFKEGKLDLAYQTMKIAARNNPNYTYGFIQYSIIQILAKKQDFERAKTWYSIIENSNFEDRTMLIDELKKQSYYLKLIQ